MKSNFEFLEKEFPILANLGSVAESYLHTDPNSCLFKLGLFGETMVNLMFQLDGLTEPAIDNTHATRIKQLKKEGLITQQVDDILYALRKNRNRAVHANYDSHEECVTLLEMAHSLGIWFMQTYGNWQYESKEEAYILPKKVLRTADVQALLDEKEALISHLSEQLKMLEPTQNITVVERARRATNASALMNLSEKETRYLIDQQLRQVKWEVDSAKIRYSKGARPQKGKNMAIAEWPTNSKIGDRGYADYALFIEQNLVGIVEAKRMLVDIPSVIDYQCKEYATQIKEEHQDLVVNNWNGYKVPFLFATNGRKYLKQLETKSGIWFLDVRRPSNIPKALMGWMSPDGIKEMLKEDIDKANQELIDTTYELLKDPNGLNLRDYQVEAIKAAEQAIIDGKNAVLLSMATGTGKTRTVLGMIYRFLKAHRFKRILFLVDRSALGEQAQDVFREVKLEGLMALDKIYNIKNLEDKEIDRETRIHVATVQSMVKRILYINEESFMPAVSDYDLIIIDEAHRGYILDKELGEDELLYRNQDDFISKYKMVVDYFDAVKIALTATPALHTSEIFGKPVFTYKYRDAVIEGHLVDHDVPHNINTKLRQEGINYEKGDIVAIYDPVTGEILNSDELEDELQFDVEKFNRQVITESFNRTALTEIAKDIDPEGEGKTLIYAVDDAHADMIVNLLKEIYEPIDLDNNAIMKITGSVGGGNKKKVMEAIKCFKNEVHPNIVVTVDLLTTGIDVPEITNLVFLRRVKSRILFEQMIGRATRQCPRIGKTHFDIFDPVGVYESLQPVNTMKPVVANPSTSYTDLLDGLNTLETDKQIENQIDMILAKLQRSKRSMSKTMMTHFKDLTGGMDPNQFIDTIREMPTETSKDKLLQHQRLFEMMNEGVGRGKRGIVISDKEDSLLSHTRDYGNGKKPEDYLNEFKAFVEENINKITALNVICTRPKELTRESLKSLKLELDRHNFTEIQLNTALKELKNEDIAADIISIIRQQALGSALLSHEERIKSAVAKLKKNHNFSKNESNWIDRIEKYLLHESVIETSSFEAGAFKNAGGFNKINKIFNNQLDALIQELNDYLYDDGGNVA